MTAPSTTAAAAVLVVDDEACVRNLSRHILEPEGFQVSLACSGEEALQLCRQRPFDLVVLDYLMPGRNGWEIYRLLREEHPNLRIAVASGYVTDEDQTELLQHVGPLFLSKPYRPDQLLQLVRRALSD